MSFLSFTNSVSCPFYLSLILSHGLSVFHKFCLYVCLSVFLYFCPCMYSSVCFSLTLNLFILRFLYLYLHIYILYIYIYLYMYRLYLIIYIYKIKADLMGAAARTSTGWWECISPRIFSTSPPLPHHLLLVVVQKMAVNGSDFKFALRW